MPFALVFQILYVAYAAYSAYSTAQAQKNSAEYSAAVAKNNEIMANAEKQAEAQRGVDEELDHRRKVRAIKGSQRAGMASAGLDLSEGSALDILTGTDVMGEIDSLRIRHNSKMEQWRINEKAKAYGADAAMYKSQAKSINPLLSGVGGGFLAGAQSGLFGSGYSLFDSGPGSSLSMTSGLKYTSASSGYGVYGKL